MPLVSCRQQQENSHKEIAVMLREILNLLAIPFIAIGSLIQWLFTLSTPAPVHQTSARMHDAQSVKKLLDDAEAAESLGPVVVPTIERHGPALLPPAAALAQAAHVLSKAPAPDLFYVLPSVAEWIRGITPDEALRIRVMPRARLEDHVYGRCRAPGLRPVAYDAPTAEVFERHDEELEDPAYLDDMLRDMAHLRC
jgi:hypothetical protein